MSEKPNKSRLFVIFLVIIVVAIITIGLFLTWIIIEDGKKSEDISFIQPNEAHMIKQERADYGSLFFYLAHFSNSKINVF